MMKAHLKIAAVLTLLAGVVLLISYTDIGAQAQTAPRYKYDPEWPKPLPNKWKMGGVTGLAVDKDDNVWVLNRPNDLTSIEIEAELDPPIADCCVHAPAMIHFDKAGNVIESFDAPQGHGMAVDKQGFIYIGQNTVRKYDPKTGKMLAAVPHIPETANGQPFDANPRISKGVQFTADGKFVAYPVFENGVDNVWIQPLDGSPGHQITHFNSERIFQFHWSPDGKRLGILRGHTDSDVVLLQESEP